MAADLSRRTARKQRRRAGGTLNAMMTVDVEGDVEGEVGVERLLRGPSARRRGGPTLAPGLVRLPGRAGEAAGLMLPLSPLAKGVMRG